MGSRIEISKEKIIRIKELYEKGQTMSYIAKEIGVSEAIIKRIILENNFMKGNTKIPFSILYDLYVKQGMSIESVAHTLNVPVGRISKELKGNSIEIRNRGCESIKIPESLLRELYETKKMNGKEIANLLNCSPSTVSNYLAKYNIPANTSKKAKKSSLEQLSYEIFYNLCIEQNKSIEDISKIYNVSISTVKVQMYNVGFSLRKVKGEIRENKITAEVLKDLYINKGLTEQEIADYLHVSRKFISRKFQQDKIHKDFKYDYITRELLEELYVNQNLAPCFIAEKLKCPPGAIQSKIQKFQLKKSKTETDIAKYKEKAYERSLKTRRSKGEIEIGNLFPTSYCNVHSVIGIELDLWYPDKNVAIEYNGDYWHSTKFPKNSGLHLAKLTMCNNKGIHLINIFERDWCAKKKQKLIKVHLARILNPEGLKLIKGTVTEAKTEDVEQFERMYNLEEHACNTQSLVIRDSNNIIISAISYKIENNKYQILRYTTHEDYVENYSPFIIFLKNTKNLPIEIKYDNRYYNSFPCNEKPFQVEAIPPELFYVKSRKALRKEEASIEYINDPKCHAVYDCGYTIIVI